MLETRQEIAARIPFEYGARGWKRYWKYRDQLKAAGYEHEDAIIQALEDYPPTGKPFDPGLDRSELPTPERSGGKSPGAERAGSSWAYATAGFQWPGKSKPTLDSKDVLWIAESFYDPDVKPEDAPSKLAWTLRWFWSHQEPKAQIGFFGKTLPDFLAATNDQDSQRRLSDDGSDVINLIRDIASPDEFAAWSVRSAPGEDETPSDVSVLRPSAEAAEEESQVST